MPSNHDDITDDYVTEMLKRDAKASSAAAAAASLGQLANRRPASGLKPNTRFLRNILRDTDNHNAALLAKEAQESRARLKKLRKEQKPEQQFYSVRQRHDPKRRRTDPPETVRNDPPCNSPPASRRHHRHSPDRRDGESRSHRHRSRSPNHASSSKHHHRDRRSSRSRDEESQGRSRHHRHRSASPRSYDKRREASDRHRRRRHSPDSEASNSDPLDAIIGPAPPSSDPPLRSRGRGTLNASSTIDHHFASTYDPSVDVQPDTHKDVDDDWDMALEALRDRQKWKQQGADRLRAAGFSEREVAKWEKGGDKFEEDVVWKKKGEGREWDRGKVLDDDGAVDVKPEWGRLKDS